MCKRYFFILLLLSIHSSCKVNKNIMDDSAIAKEMSAKKVARKHAATQLNKKTVESKYKVNFNNRKTKQSLSVTLRMKKDEYIWIKGSKLITVFKAKITPNAVQYYSPLAKNYFVGDFSMIKDLLGVTVNFDQLQNLFLGQAIQNLKETKQEIEIRNNRYHLTPQQQSEMFRLFFVVNPSHFKLDNQYVIDVKNNNRMDVQYPAYEAVKGEIYPSKIVVKSKSEKSYSEIDLTLRSVDFNRDLQIPFRIPAGYKRLTF